MDRREFLTRAAGTFTMLAAPSVLPGRVAAAKQSQPPQVTLFLAGDVMTGRGIDQVLPHPSTPRIYESYVKRATRYVELAEEAHGPIPRPVDFSYIWGDALTELERVAPDVRIVNLETAVTASSDYWQGKGINYRMHPANVPCLTAARIDCCALANNHVLDWGFSGLAETLETLRHAGLETAGAGRHREEAQAPAILEVPGKGRILVFSFGTVTSGIPPQWAAGKRRPGVNLLPDLTDGTVSTIAATITQIKKPGDLVVASIHWGGNWGYRIPQAQQRFARRLIDEAAVDVVHGHSSHHPKGIEVYHERPILYGCGDFLNDYEGISGYESFRGDLALAYFVRLDAESGKLLRIWMTPFRMQRFRLIAAAQEDARWLRETLGREGGALGSRVDLLPNWSLVLGWG